MTCNGTYASAEQYLDFWCLELTDANEEALVNRYLQRAASTINMARQASGACDCTLSGAAVNYLRDLSIVMAVVYHACPCARPDISVDEKRMYWEQVSEELRQIRVGELELCDGETGADFPAIGWAEQGWTAFSTAEIIENQQLRTNTT